MKIRAAAEGGLEALTALNAEVQRLHVELYPQYFKPRAGIAALKEFFQEALARACGHSSQSDHRTG